MFHADLPAQDIHVIGYVQAGDPGAIGAGKAWIDTSGGSGAYELAVRNALNNGWEYIVGHGASPDDAQYVVMALDATLTQERVLAVDSHLTLTDGGAGGNATVSVDLTAGFAWTGSHTFSQDTAFGLVSPDWRVHARDDAPSAGAYIPILQLEVAYAGGAGANGLGAGILFTGETTLSENQPMAGIYARWDSATHASRMGLLEFRAYYQSSDNLMGVITAVGASVADGNARGQGVFDFQGSRTNAAFVATGTYSAIFGGGNHSVSQVYSGIFAGFQNEISGSYSACIGGSLNEVSEQYAAAIAGRYALADKYGQIVSSAGRFADSGDAQNTIEMHLREEITHADASWHPIYPDGGAGVKHVTIATDTSWTFEYLLVGTDQGANKVMGYHIVGVIRNTGGVVAVPQFGGTSLDNDDTTYDTQPVADAVNTALQIQVRKNVLPFNEDIRWSCFLSMTEVTYPT